MPGIGAWNAAGPHKRIPVCLIHTPAVVQGGEDCNYSGKRGPGHQRLGLPEVSLRAAAGNRWHITVSPYGEQLILKMAPKAPSFSADLGTF